MIVSLFTVIHPRLEFNYLEEWICFHKAIGVDFFYVYNNGYISDDNGVFEFNCNEIISNPTIWKKKPYADYFLDYSEEQIKKILTSLQNKYKCLKIIDWSNIPFRDTPNGNFEDYSGQMKAFKNCVNSNKSDWWIFIDPDEFIFPKKHGSIKKFIQDNSQFSCFYIRQKVFEKRQRNKLVTSLIKWGYCPNQVKTIIKSEVSKFDSHRSLPKNGEVRYVNREIMEYYHFRGEMTSIGYNTWSSHKKYVNFKFKKSDDSLYEFSKKVLNNNG